MVSTPVVPAANPIRETLERQLARQLQPAGAPVVRRLAGDTGSTTALIRDFYASRDFQPIWTGSESNHRRGRILLEAIAEGARHGLNPRRYQVPAIEAALADEDWTAVEVLMCDALLLQARHRADGILDPRVVAPDWDAFQPETKVAPLLDAVAGGADPRKVLDQLWPAEPAYWRLLQAKQALQVEVPPSRRIVIPPGPVLRRGMTDPRVALLRERLSLQATLRGQGSPVYDRALADAVAAFQDSAGLQTDGLTGPRTLEALNKSPEQRSRQIDANLERWRWLPTKLPADHILVNAAAFRLTAMHDGREELSMSVIVGRPTRPTPALRQDLQYLVFNPYWEIPETIAVEDKLPELRRNPSRLADQGLEAARLGTDRMVPVDQIDWRDVAAQPFPYRLRQRPGPHNPLGHLKFMLPNEQAVYLHDTPDRALFGRCERSFSSGCVRVADALQLAEWVLQFQTQAWDRAQIETQITSGVTRTVRLETPVPVFIVYLTIVVDAAGTLRFHRDLYDRDLPIINALQAPINAPQVPDL